MGFNTSLFSQDKKEVLPSFLVFLMGPFHLEGLWVPTQNEYESAVVTDNSDKRKLIVQKQEITKVKWRVWLLMKTNT